MNKRRRYQAKRRRQQMKNWKRRKLDLFFNLNKLPYTQIKKSTDSWLGIHRLPLVIKPGKLYEDN